MKQKAIVKSLNGDRLEVFVVRSSGCGDCSTCGACEAKMVKLNFDNKVDAKAGDLIELDYKVSSMMKYSALLYLFPLAMLILGIVIGYSRFAEGTYKELYSFLLGLALMLVAYFIVHNFDKEFKEDTLISIKKLDWEDLISE